MGQTLLDWMCQAPRSWYDILPDQDPGPSQIYGLTEAEHRLAYLLWGIARSFPTA